jgi:hypothetical protein
MDVELLPGIYPAVIKSYDKVTRTCRVDIPGITQGGDAYPTAEIMYPIGDKSRSGTHATEIEMLAGDTVWVMFIGGDSRYPVIYGYRNPRAGNSADWRRFHHANIELTADGTLKLNAATVEINATNLNIASNVAITGDTLTHNSKNVGSTHSHSNVQPGSGNSGGPV